MLTAKVLLAIKSLLGYLLRHWREFAVLIIIAAVYLLGGHNEGQKVEAKWSARWHQHAAEDALATAATERAAREREQGWAAFFDMTVNNLETEQNATDKKLAAALARHRAGGLRLPVCPAAGVPEGAADPAGGTQAATGELPGQPDQPLGEFLLMEAARADDVALQLQACQVILRGIR